MKTRHPKLVQLLITIALVLGVLGVAHGQPVNQSNLWFGGDEGIEVVWRTGENLAYTTADPKIDPSMTRRISRARFVASVSTMRCRCQIPNLGYLVSTIAT